jgi:hypothetical protein
MHAAANDARIKVLSVQVTAVAPLSDRPGAGTPARHRDRPRNN